MFSSCVAFVLENCESLKNFCTEHFSAAKLDTSEALKNFLAAGKHNNDPTKIKEMLNRLQGSQGGSDSDGKEEDDGERVEPR